jgi:hypothetical protein
MMSRKYAQRLVSHKRSAKERTFKSFPSFPSVNFNPLRANGFRLLEQQVFENLQHEVDWNNFGRLAEDTLRLN